MEEVGYFVWWQYEGREDKFYEFIDSVVDGEFYIYRNGEVSETIMYKNGEEKCRAIVYNFDVTGQKYDMKLSNYGYTKAFIKSA